MKLKVKKIFSSDYKPHISRFEAYYIQKNKIDQYYYYYYWNHSNWIQSKYFYTNACKLYTYMRNGNIINIMYSTTKYNCTAFYVKASNIPVRKKIVVDNAEANNFPNVSLIEVLRICVKCRNSVCFDVTLRSIRTDMRRVFAFTLFTWVHLRLGCHHKY